MTPDIRFNEGGADCPPIALVVLCPRAAHPRFNEGGADCPPIECYVACALCNETSFNEGGADCPPIAFASASSNLGRFTLQ